MATAVRIPLRERKYAQTKLALMNALLSALEQQSLEDIAVRALCDTAEVSEATFFNYFPRKTDVLAYAIQMWTLEMLWHGRHAAPGTSGLAVVHAVFDRAAHQFQDRPGWTGEVLAYQARLRERPATVEVTRAERLLAFPGLEGIEELPLKGLDSILVPGLEQAIQSGELPPNTPVTTVLVALLAIFFGIPLALRVANPRGIGSMYRQQLALLWAGIRGATGGRNP